MTWFNKPYYRGVIPKHALNIVHIYRVPSNVNGALRIISVEMTEPKFKIFNYKIRNIRQIGTGTQFFYIF